MEMVKTIAILPLDYELIVPSAMGSGEQRKGYNDEETKETKKLRISRFAEKIQKWIEKRGYNFIYVNPEKNQDNIKAIVDKIQTTRKQLMTDLGEKEKIFISDEIKDSVNNISELADSDVFIVSLCRERIGTASEAITRSFGLLGQVAGGESWKDEYAGYIPSTDYTYIHAFIIDSKTLEVYSLLGAINTESLYRSKSVANSLAYNLSLVLPKKKGN